MSNSNFYKIAKGTDFAKKLSSAKFMINNKLKVNPQIIEKMKDPSYMMKNFKLGK